MSVEWGLEFTETGLEAVRKVLKAEDPRASRILNKNLRGVGAMLAAAASARFPNGGSYTVRLNSKGLIVSASSGSAAGNDWQHAPRGVLTAILESYGEKGAATAQAASCTATLNARYGTKGRFLNEAWRQGKGRYHELARIAAFEAERDLQTQLNAAGCGE